MARSQKRIQPHSQKVKEQKERELDLDFDGDGLTEREERKYGLNPLSPDSDDDGLYDSKEVEQVSNPHSYSKEQKVPPSVERGSEEAEKQGSRGAEERKGQFYKEKLRDAYLYRVQTLLNAPVSYAALYNQIAEDSWLGRSLDERVIAAELHSGSSLEEAKCLIAQSPYVQWQLSEGQWDKDSAIQYVELLASQFQPNKEQEWE